jgi:hypothetical protein
MVAFIRVVHDGKIIEQYVCSQEIQVNTSGEDMFKVLSGYSKYFNVSWLN